MIEIKPLFRWAGGKTKYVKHIDPLLPARTPTYVEPFFGGGAVFCHVYNNQKADRFIINDVKLELVDLYRMIKESPLKLITGAEDLQDVYLSQTKEQRKEFYYKIRKMYWGDKRSEVLLFLLKTCFNGIWQMCQESKGLFGTPCGLLNEKTPFINREQIMAWSEAFQKTEILHGDFSEVVVPPNSLVYCDPPYRNSFTTYGTTFGDVQQENCVDWCRDVSKSTGSIVLLSNKSDDSFFEKKASDAEFRYFDATHTAGRRKQHKAEDGSVSHSALKVREVVMKWK